MTALYFKKRRSRRCIGFTLIELMVALSVIAVLAALLLTAITNSRTKARRTHCLSNLKQVGVAMQLYLNDARTLPGPAYYGISTFYNISVRDFEQFGGAKSEGPVELVGYLRRELGLPVAPRAPDKAEARIAICPEFVNEAPKPPPNPDFEGYSYFATRLVVNSKDRIITNAFGYLDGNRYVTALPIAIEKISSPAGAWAVMDADKVSIARAGLYMSPWRVNIPSIAVHGQTWNRLYFDGHVASVRSLD